MESTRAYVCDAIARSDLTDRPTDRPADPVAQPTNCRWRWQRFPLLLLARLVVYPLFLVWWAVTLPIWLPLRLLRSSNGASNGDGRQGAKKTK